MANTKNTFTSHPSRTYGYVRVSTRDQEEALQLEAMDKAGIHPADRYIDKGVSGSKTSRPAFDQMLADVESGKILPGDKIAVWKLDRLGRSSGHTITTMQTLVSKGIHVHILTDGIDSSTPAGEAMISMLAIFAQMELAFIKERTRAGLAAAKAQGHTGGRARAMDSSQARIAQSEYDKGEKVADIAKSLKVSVPTIYRYLSATKA
jgi:DNA invertase Pin-like site-specific DNA recombinase